MGDVRVLIHERHELPLVRFVVRVGGGANLDPPGQAGLADLTAQLLKEGAGSREALVFSEAMDQLGAMFDTAADHDSILIQLSVLRSNLEKASALLLDALLEPRFDEPAFKRIKTQLLAGLRQRDDQPSIVARLVSHTLLFGKDHPIGRPVDGTVGSVETIGREDVRAFWASHVARDLQILVAGDVKPDDVRAIFERRLAARPKLAAPARLRPAKPVERGSQIRVVIVDRPNSPQTVIRFVWPGVTYADERRIPLVVAAAALGGTFTSRLNNNLREQKGYTYGAGAGLEYYQGSEDPVRGPSAIGASSSVRSDVTGASVREFLREFDRMRVGDLTADELEKARSSIRNMRVLAAESLDGLVSELDTIVTYGLPPGSVAQDLARLDAVDLAAANAAARALLVPDGGVLVLVGEAKAIRKQLLDVPGLPVPVVVTPDHYLSGR
jgi:predicted Zn-dependent peptidase